MFEVWAAVRSADSQIIGLCFPGFAALTPGFMPPSAARTRVIIGLCFPGFAALTPGFMPPSAPRTHKLLAYVSRGSLRSPRALCRRPLRGLGWYLIPQISLPDRVSISLPSQPRFNIADRLLRQRRSMHKKMPRCEVAAFHHFRLVCLQLIQGRPRMVPRMLPLRLRLFP